MLCDMMGVPVGTSLGLVGLFLIGLAALLGLAALSAWLVAVLTRSRDRRRHREFLAFLGLIHGADGVRAGGEAWGSLGDQLPACRVRLRATSVELGQAPPPDTADDRP